MRSSLGGHYAGAGTRLAFIEPEEYDSYAPVQVRLPSDAAAANDYADMHGPVVRYNLYAAAEGGAAVADI